MSLFRLLKPIARAPDNIPVKPLVPEGGHIPVKPVTPESGPIPGKGVPEVNTVVPPDATATSPTGDNGMHPVAKAAVETIGLAPDVTSPPASQGTNFLTCSFGCILMLAIIAPTAYPVILWIRKSTRDSRDV